jgi:PIN domain nuclease of toxin-antitoxin system
MHGDPADRLIAATATLLGAALVTGDERLRAVPGLRTIW